ncbi:MAG: ComEC/Rec2 family competence protein [Patescibacteria group bacterium]
MQNARLYLLLICFFLGVIISEIFSPGFYLSLFFVLVGSVFLFTHFLIGSPRSFLVISLCILFFGGGACRIASTQYVSDHLLPEVGETVEFELKIKSDVDEREFSDRVLAELVSAKGKILNSREKILLTLPKGSGVAYRDTLLVSGELVEPEPFVGNGGVLFDYPWYLKKDGVQFILRVEKIISIEEYKNFSFLRYLYSFKSTLLYRMEQILPYPESGLLSGILLGEKGTLSPELRADLISSGLIHIAVLSGYNVAVIAALILFLFSSFSPVIRFSVATGCILLLILMTGADPAGVRAGIMGFLLLLGGYLGRVSDAGRLLSIAGFLMVLFNPYLLLHDPGFQLSFLATAGLIFLTPLIQAIFSRFYPRLPVYVSGLMATTLGAQVFVTPLLLHQTGVFSLYSLPANILVLPFVPVAMFLGAGALLLSLVSNMVAAPVAYLSYVFLYYSEFIASFVSGLPLSTLTIGSVPLTVVFLTYTLLFVSVYFINRSFEPLPGASPGRPN